MNTLSKKIDFAVVFAVKHANPNGDPLNGNRPRLTEEGFGEVSDVCLKRKMRDRLLESGYPIFVQSDDRKIDDCTSLRDRAEKNEKLNVLFQNKGKKKNKNTDAADSEQAESDKGESIDKLIAKVACESWMDVRAFGQLIALKGGKKNTDGDNEDAGKGKGVSIGIRGPVTVRSAFSTTKLNPSSIQITKSVNSEDADKRASDTMGMKHRVSEALYLFQGSINPKLAERTGFSDADADAIKKVLQCLFDNDASSARPEGSMYVQRVYWWEQPLEKEPVPSWRLHESVKPNAAGIPVFDNSVPRPEILGKVPEPEASV